MKKFILLFASVASLFSGCSEYIVGYDASTIEHLCRINYTSLTKIDVELFSFNAELIGHTWKDGVGTLYFNKDITVVRNWAFSGCDSLTSITIPESVTTIGEGAFRNCSSLTSVYCKATTPPTGGDNMFYKNAPGRTIYVPTESVNAYKSASYWSKYKYDIVGYDF